jgi:hypothetical protein
MLPTTRPGNFVYTGNRQSDRSEDGQGEIPRLRQGRVRGEFDCLEEDAGYNIEDHQSRSNGQQRRYEKENEYTLPHAAYQVII